MISFWNISCKKLLKGETHLEQNSRQVYNIEALLKYEIYLLIEM